MIDQKKEDVFRTWDQFMLLLETTKLISFNDPTIHEIELIQSEKKKRLEQSHERKTWEPVLASMTFERTNDIFIELLLKWEELVIQSFLYLQEARKRGGTLGHKIGPLWSFQKEQKEKYAELLLKRKSNTT
jgi:hypothetical protein